MTPPASSRDAFANRPDGGFRRRTTKTPTNAAPSRAAATYRDAFVSMVPRHARLRLRSRRINPAARAVAEAGMTHQSAWAVPGANQIARIR